VFGVPPFQRLNLKIWYKRCATGDHSNLVHFNFIQSGIMAYEAEMALVPLNMSLNNV
jgi:hypothetical protein